MSAVAALFHGCHILWSRCLVALGLRVARVNWDIYLLDLVFGLLLLTASVIVLVCDRMFVAGAMLLIGGLALACPLLRA